MKITSTELPTPSPLRPFPLFRKWTGPVTSDAPRNVVMFFDYTTGVIVYPPKMAGEFTDLFISCDDPAWEPWHGNVTFSSE